jgi:ribonuclease Y
MDLIAIIAAVVATVVGVIIGIFLGKKIFAQDTQKQVDEAEAQVRRAEAQAQKTVDDAKILSETLKEKKLLEAKEHFNQLKNNHEKDVNQRTAKIAENEAKLKQHQQSLNDKTAAVQIQIQEYDQLKENMESQMVAFNIKKTELDRHHEEHIKRLEKVAGLSAEQAKTELMEVVKEEARTRAMAHVKDIMEEAKVNASKEAKKIIIQSIQRLGAEVTIENAITVFNLESDEIKGQIIGREGRNIRALEAATGVDLIIDDTPEAIVLSCFDPLRREIARLSLQRLVQDGRIHPARIEEVVEKTKKQIEEQIMEIGERTIIELGVHGLHKDLVRLVGKMRFRSSYGQNLLMHSKETANLCGIMASELGLGQKVVKLAKRAGLLHDIGKVPDEETELSHALLGAKLAEKAGEHA